MKILLLCFLTALLAAYVTAKPYEMNSFTGQADLERCNRMPDIDIQCQKCAKITKSTVAYPMCCTDKEDAYRWCMKYLNFGLHKRNHQKDLPPWERVHLTKDQQKHFLRDKLSSAEIQDMYRPDVETNMV